MAWVVPKGNLSESAGRSLWAVAQRQQSLIGKLLGALATTALFAACSFHVGDLGLVSQDNVGLHIKPIRQGVQAKDCEYRLLFLIPISGSFFPSFEDAMNKAGAQVPEGNIMTNAAFYEEPTYMVLVNRLCLRVKGDVGGLE